jgi:hypothetical protein
MSNKPHNATILKHEGPDMCYSHLVIHDDTCIDFLDSLREETRRLVKEGITGKVDLYFRLCTFCRIKYGEVYWQTLSMGVLEELEIEVAETAGVTAWTVAARLKGRLDEVNRFVSHNQFIGEDEKKIILDLTGHTPIETGKGKQREEKG